MTSKRGRAAIAGALAILLPALAVPPSAAAPEDPSTTKPDFIALRSDPGDPLGLGVRRVLEQADSLVGSFQPGSAEVGTDVLTTLVDIRLDAPTGQALGPGTYTVAHAGAPATASTPGFSVDLHDRTCTGPAEFTIREYSYQGGSSRLTADYRGWCGADRSGPSYSGSIHHLSTPPTARDVAAPVRLAGADRVETAIAISRDRFASTTASRVSADELAQNVVLARSDAFADSLGGAVLAAKEHGPLLLTPPTGPVDPRTMAEIDRILTGTAAVFVLGGDQAISAEAETELEIHGHQVVRVAGTDRYDTAAKIADAMYSQIDLPSRVFLVTGHDFPDGLVAAASAIPGGNTVLLLTDGTSMAPATTAWLASHNVTFVDAIGGPAHLADPNVPSVVGADRYDTAVNLAQTSQDYAEIGVASGESFADALAGAAHIGALHGPLVLTPPGSAPQAVRDVVSSRTRDAVIIYGGASAVASSVDATL